MTVQTVADSVSRARPNRADPRRLVARQLQGWAAPGRRPLAIASVLTVLDTLPAVGFAAGLAGAVGRLAAADGPLWPWLLLTAVSLLARALLGQGATLAAARAAAAIKGEVRRDVLAQIFSGRRSGADGVTAAVEGVEALDGYFARFHALKTAAMAGPLLIVTAAAFASPVAAAILLLTLIPFAAAMALAGMAAASESRAQFAALQALTSLFLDRVRALPVLIAFQAESRTTAGIARASDELAHRTGRVLKVAFLSSGVLEFFAALSVALVAVYCGFNLLRLLPFPVPETLTLTRAFFVLALAPEVYAPLRRLAAAYHDRQAAEAAAPALVGASTARPDHARAPVRWSAAPAIAFRDVAIRYGAGAEAISAFTLDIPAGSTVAITGASGSGKSSLLHLLLGLAPLSAGEVEIGDARLSVIGDLAGAVGWASQAPVVIPGSLRDNIAMARPAADSGAILRAAGQTGLSGDLDRVLDERGGGLSGGERRRLGLARALLSDARVLLLDEPTANLDRDTEAALIEVLRLALPGRTTIIATHSRAVMALADQVVRL
jgi:ATP-binding cassette, subfamily C, bacterial CydD